MAYIYLDHAATTPLLPEAAKAMMEIYTGEPGNASSIHHLGRAARQRMNDARDTIAEAVGCQPSELMFTSGGTESDNAAITGAARAGKLKGKTHIITSAVEHHAVLHTCEALAKEGFRTTILPVDETGRISPSDVEKAITPETALISVMYANNETGTVQPIEEIGDIARLHGVLFHVDAVQALSMLPIDLKRMPVDLMSFSAHKINGPQGIGALYISKRTAILPLLYGGSQERKRRGGTENVAGIVGFAKSVEHSVNSWPDKKLFMDKLRYKWVESMRAIAGSDQLILNGHHTQRVPHIVNLSFIGINRETMLMNLDLEGIAASSASACTAGALEKSHVLEAMGLPPQRLSSAVRFSFGLGNTLEELEIAAKKVETFYNRIRTNA
ncbi:cysteine desulfurase family protein [Paenibacillus nasutitermitis]|uniref:cysteine desulfurase n=1 Tax=Paenibacillus nasutitermitis TaxID=1652958 RepID=A0A916YPJ8_9BACL|nr:cysteine desulfurase family protein [Paenibacillus nasutitermitis]GGD54993.1 cysteine desulfurase [Paenibacillus nasutitermitis]